MNSLDDLEPVWMPRARREIGVKELPGVKHHPRILEYHAATRLRAKDEGVAWCSAFVCWVFEGVGIASTRSAAARSWLKWGQELAVPRPGCVVVLTRPSADNPQSGHVGFYVGEEGSDILVLSGNQNNSVCIKPYPKARLLAFRWPEI